MLHPRLCLSVVVTAALAAAAGCVCGNPCAVMALEDRETQLQAEVKDLERAVSAKAKAAGKLVALLDEGGASTARGVSLADARTGFSTRLGGKRFVGAVTFDGAKAKVAVQERGK